jgi:hypothetical protein
VFTENVYGNKVRGFIAVFCINNASHEANEIKLTARIFFQHLGYE